MGIWLRLLTEPMEKRFHSTKKQHIELHSNFNPTRNSVNVTLNYSLFKDLVKDRITQLGKQLTETNSINILTTHLFLD